MNTSTSVLCTFLFNSPEGRTQYSCCGVSTFYLTDHLLLLNFQILNRKMRLLNWNSNKTSCNQAASANPIQNSLITRNTRLKFGSSSLCFVWFCFFFLLTFCPGDPSWVDEWRMWSKRKVWAFHGCWRSVLPRSRGRCWKGCFSRRHGMRGDEQTTRRHMCCLWGSRLDLHK